MKAPRNRRRGAFCFPQRLYGLNFGCSYRNGSVSPILALVAMGVDGFERAGPGAQHVPCLAFTLGWIRDRLRGRELVRSRAQQPVVVGGGGITRQRTGGGRVHGAVDRQFFHWSGDGGAGPTTGLGRDAYPGRRGCRKRHLVHDRSKMDCWGVLPVVHGHAHYRVGPGDIDLLASAQATR
jgi:hypothetical protein